MVCARWLGIIGVLFLGCSGKVTGESTGTPGTGGTAGVADAGTSTGGEGTSPVCSSGASLACVGTDGCAGFQLCRDDGTGWGSCECTPTFVPPPPDEPTEPVGGCAAVSYSAEAVARDLLFLLDRSSAMEVLSETGVSWDQAVRTAVSDFVQHPAAAGIAVGLQYFPLGGQAPLSCEADYATPAVPLALLPQNMPALVQSLGMGEAGGGSPTGPALQGAINYMKLATVERPYALHTVVLVTAGLPTECEPADVSGLASIAAAAHVESPYVNTLVIALGSGLESLTSGSTQVHLIAGGDVTDLVRNILLDSFAISPGCVFELPPPPEGEQFDVHRISVQYANAVTSELITVLKLNSRQDCALNGDEGWFFDDPVTPSRIELCADTCAKMPGSRVEILFGCEPPLTP